MSKKKDESIKNWLVTNLRFTIFPSPEFEIKNEQNVWEELLGEAPEKIDIQPKMGVKSMNGPYDEGALIFGVTPVRVDWHYVLHEDNLTQGEDIPNAGMFTEKVQNFLRFIEKWVKSTPDISSTRIAFGAVLIHTSKTNEEATESLNYYLPFKLPYEDRDFLYQVSRRIESKKKAGLEINKLRKWQKTQVDKLVDSTGREILVSNRHIIRLELDVNTSQEYQGIFKQKDTLDIFPELVNLGIEVSKKGDD